VRISFYRGERDLTELAQRLFGARKAEAARAEEALLEHNPQLAHLDKVDEGAPIVVPDVEGLTPTEDAVPVAAAALEALAGSVREALDEVGARLQASAAAERARADESRAVAGKRQVKKAAAESRPLARRLERVQAKADARADFATELDARAEALGKQVERDLAKLLEVARESAT
jgi:hypothetical protein